jgi:hypothetical protein
MYGNLIERYTVLADPWHWVALLLQTSEAVSNVISKFTWI